MILLKSLLQIYKKGDMNRLLSMKKLRLSLFVIEGVVMNWLGIGLQALVRKVRGTVIRPLFWKKELEQYKFWLNVMKLVEESYNSLIELGAKPEEARSVLPNSLKTEIVVSMNLREWRHFF